MTPLLQSLTGVVAATIAVASLLPYIANIVRGVTRPHLVTWLVWTAMTAVAFAAQVVGGGGPGAWATGCTAALCVVILLLAATHRGEREVAFLDLLSLSACALAGLAWALTRDPTGSVVLVSIIDAMAFVPTIRKSIGKPQEETLLTHALSLSNARRHESDSRGRADHAAAGTGLGVDRRARRRYCCALTRTA